MDKKQLQDIDKNNVTYSWSVQGNEHIIIDHAERIYLWDINDKRYIDFCAGLLNVNIGHSNAHVLDAMKKQMDKLTYVAPLFGTEPKARLAEMIGEITPGDLNHVFYTNGGAEANENAIKVARWYTGRHKIYTAWRSYHGATAGAITLTGDPRRWAAEPGIPGVVHFFGPFSYNSPFGSRNSEEECENALRALKEQIMLDGPKTIAAILLEPIVGTNGIIVPPDGWLKGVREICDENGILMIADEVMTGWGRTGEWFGIDNWGIVPDMIVTAKGITSAYVPLGALIWNESIHEYFRENPFVGGLTNSGHALACAAGIANIETYRNENLIDNSKENGAYLFKKLENLKDKHPSIGDVRGGKGLFCCIQLAENRQTREPLAGFADVKRNVSKEIMKRLYDKGLYLFAKWDFLFIAPPLCITKDEIDEAVSIVDGVLEYHYSFI